MTDKCKLSPADLRCACDPKMFKFKNTSALEPLDEVIGQERAVQAISFGLDMQSPGYNIFVTGIEETGKSTIVGDIVAKFAAKLPPSHDWCMVNNFKDEFCPKAISLPTGTALKFKKQMAKVIEDLKQDLSKAFAGKTYQAKSSEIKQSHGEKQRQLFEQLDQSAAAKGLTIQRTKMGFQTLPLIDEKPITPEDFKKLSEEQRQAIETNMRALQVEIEETVLEVNKIGQAMAEGVEKLKSEAALFTVRNRLNLIRNEYEACTDATAFLQEVQDDIIDNVNDFIASQQQPQAEAPGMPPAAAPSFHHYEVNVLVDRSGAEGAPVIFETNPTYHNVFGQIEKRAVMGALMTDFTMVQAGSLLRANGGYVILEVESILRHTHVWEALKRALQNKCLAIEDIAASAGFGTTSLRPEPIPLEVKVILIGSYHLFQLLQANDSKFNKIFRVRADFDHEVARSETTMLQYARFIARTCKEQDLLPLTPKGVATVVEFGEKQISHKNKLSLRFGAVLGLLREADYWARQAKARSVSEKYVRKAIDEYHFRYNLYEAKTHESYADETLLIDVDGAVTGQVNALAVYQIGNISFGRPSRITAETYMGKEGIVNIERESKLSGKTHDKGVLILSGFLGRTFAQKYPLSLSISITFEQNYGGIDGDSASSTELYAILSSLSGIPIKQGTAVTGSVNQKGRIQAIGGANQKIEGFYDVCKTKGITGSQGVMIPHSNVKNLMLKKEVVAAVKKNRFHIYQVASVEEGIEILTGVPAGEKDENGDFPPDTVFGKVQAKLKAYVKRGYDLKKEFEG
jgi:predicted ATP-dependent protease